MLMRRSAAIAIAFLTLGSLTGAVAGQTAGCTVVEGTSVANLQVGMTTAVAFAVAGPPARRQAAGGQVIYSLRPPWSHLVTESGVVQRIASGAAECRTARHVGPGSTALAIRQAYTGASASMVTSTAEGDLLSYPFIGVAFLLRGDRVVAVEVFRPEGRAAGAAPHSGPTGPAAPGPAPSAVPRPAPAPAPGAWSIRSLTARVEGYTLIVTGTVENNSRAQTAYAEIRAFNVAGGQAATGDGPLYPSPIPTGKTATFEARMTIDEVIRRYTVTIRPVGSLSATLAETAGEIADVQGFATVVGRSVTMAVEVNASPPARTDFVLVITNGSPLTIAGMTVTVDITGACRMHVPAVPFREVLTSSTIIEGLRPGTSARANIQLSQGPCYHFQTWSAQQRIGELRIAR